MQTQDHRKINSPDLSLDSCYKFCSPKEKRQGHGVHVCNKCGWSFPNPHPSAKQRRSHKKICGTVEGRELATTSEENKPNLDEHLSEDDSKNPSLEVMKKVEEVAITRRSRSGVGSRSDEDVFSDAVNEFADVPAVAGSDVVGETAVVMQGSSSSEDAEVTQQVVGKAVEDAGDLYPPNSDNGTQLQNVECSRPENERLEIDMPSQHHLSSSTIDSISNSDSSVREASVSESTLQCSKKIDVVLDSEEKDDLEAALDKKSEDTANVSSENAGKASEAILLHQKVNGDDDNDCSYEVNFAGETNSSEKGKVKTDKSEDFTNIPTDFAGKTSEAVSVPQMVNTEDLNILPANAAMDANERQVEGFFDARNISFSKDDYAGQINNVEEASNVEADSSLEMLEGHGSINVPDALPLKEHSEDVLEDYEDHKTEKLPDVVSIDLAQEVECVELGKDDANKDFFFSMSLDEPSKSLNKNSEDIVAEALDQEDCSAEEVSVEKKVETHATDADICGPISVAVHPVKDDNEIVQGEMVTSPEEQTSVAFVDTNLRSVLDESGNLSHCINGVQHVLNDLEHDKKDTQIFDALEADSAKAEEEKLPTTDSAVEYDVRIREVEENLSGSTPIVAQSDDGRDDEVEVQRDDEHVSKTALSETSKASLEKFEDSETEVKDLGSSSKHMVGGECVNLLGTNVISGIDNNANMTEDTHFEENCVASDSVDASLFNNEMNNDTQQDENEVFEDAKERENFDQKVSGEVCLGKVDLDLISDNYDSIDLIQNTSNKIEAGVQVEAISAVEDSVTKNKEGSDSNLASDNGNLVKQKESVPDLDVQVNSISQTDSLEGNWGSASVLSAFSDATAGTEFGSQPSQSSVIVEKAGLQPNSNDVKSDIFKLPAVMQSPEQKIDESGENEGVPEAQTSEKANEWSGSKKTEEIIAKVANWSTASGKEQHMSLQSFLGDSSSPNAKDNLPLKSQETEKTVTDNNAKEPADEAAMGEMQKEWNSPARYPTNIKREKGKVRSKPYWAPFICCSSVQTS